MPPEATASTSARQDPPTIRNGVCNKACTGGAVYNSGTDTCNACPTGSTYNNTTTQCIECGLSGAGIHGGNL